MFDLKIFDQQALLILFLLYKPHSLDYPYYGDGWALVGSPVFNTGGGLFCRPRWVRLPSIPARSKFTWR